MKIFQTLSYFFIALFLLSFQYCKYRFGNQSFSTLPNFFNISHEDRLFFFQVLYCDACRESCHPKRGPLATHNLGPPRGSWQSNGGKGSRPENTPVCNDHNGEAVTLYCALCKIAICALCLRDRHAAHPHDVLPLAAACKAQKVSALLPRK